MAGELSSKMKLYNRDGTVNYGWSKKPLYDLNLEDARFMAIRPLQRIRAKKWDYYYVFADKFIFSIALVHMGYAGMVLAYFYDCDSNEVVEDMLSIPLASGFEMARNSDTGVSTLKKGKLNIAFSVDDGKRHIIVNYPSFNGYEGLKADFILYHYDNLESICVATPIEKGRMNFTQKTCCMAAGGYIKKGSHEYKLNPKTDVGGIDWSRGYLARNTFWNWACTSAISDGHTVGLNLCCGLNDTLDTENAFFIDGKCHKVDRVDFKFDKTCYLKPWIVKSNDNKVDLKFIPQKERASVTDYKLVKSEMHQMFGHFTGELLMEDGSRFALKDIRGTIEDHHARW